MITNDDLGLTVCEVRVRHLEALNGRLFYQGFRLIYADPTVNRIIAEDGYLTFTGRYKTRLKHYRRGSAPVLIVNTELKTKHEGFIENDFKQSYNDLTEFKGHMYHKSYLIFFVSNAICNPLESRKFALDLDTAKNMLSDFLHDNKVLKPLKDGNITYNGFKLIKQKLNT